MRYSKNYFYMSFQNNCGLKWKYFSIKATKDWSTMALSRFEALFLHFNYYLFFWMCEKSSFKFWSVSYFLVKSLAKGNKGSFKRFINPIFTCFTQRLKNLTPLLHPPPPKKKMFNKCFCLLCVSVIWHSIGLLDFNA